MPKAGEKTYFGAIGKEGVAHSLAKPYSDTNAGALLTQVAAIIELLPRPPARLLDLGCGTGWTSQIYAQCGYEVVGQDISEEAIAIANDTNQLSQRVSFVASDYEGLDYKNEFDCATFFDSLHHAEDSTLALRCVYEALKDGGICITCEPGRGHGSSEEAKAAVRKFGVTERDMPPSLVRRDAKKAGFRSGTVYPDTGLIHKAFFKKSLNRPLLGSPAFFLLRLLLVNALALAKTYHQGIVVLQK